MNRHKPRNIKPKNGFSAQFQLPKQVQDAAFLLASAAKTLDGVFVLELAESPGEPPYAITMAVYSDREKIDQLVALTKEWTVIKPEEAGDCSATSAPQTPVDEHPP